MKWTSVHWLVFKLLCQHFGRTDLEKQSGLAEEPTHLPLCRRLPAGSSEAPLPDTAEAAPCPHLSCTRFRWDVRAVFPHSPCYVCFSKISPSVPESPFQMTSLIMSSPPPPPQTLWKSHCPWYSEACPALQGPAGSGPSPPCQLLVVRVRLNLCSHTSSL